MKVIKLGDEGLGTQHYTPTDIDLEGVITGLEADKEVYKRLENNVMGEARSESYLLVKNSDRTTEKVKLLTTDIESIKFVDESLWLKVNKVLGGEVVEEYTLTAETFAIPRIIHVTDVKDSTNGIVYTVERWQYPRRQRIFFNVPARAGTANVNTAYTINFTKYRFGGSTPTMTASGVTATLQAGNPNGIITIKPGSLSGHVELTGTW